MTGQSWCIAGFIVKTVLWIWHTRRGQTAKALSADTQATVWLAAAIIIGSFK
jgi:hypothetical protein